METIQKKLQKQDGQDILRPDPMAREPLYKQVRREVVKSLTRGEWKPGERLPSESALAHRYQVGISTVRAAIGEFVATRVLTRKQGKGTFVSLHNQQRYNYQFFHVIRDDGVQELPVSELISLRKDIADDETADLLHLPRRAGSLRVFKLRQVLRVRQTPIVASDIVIPAALFKGMNEKVLRTGGKALYAVYQERFGINVIRTLTELRGVAASAGACGIFGLPKDAPLLEVRRIAFTFDDLPVEVRVSQIDTRNFHFRFVQGDGA